MHVANYTFENYPIYITWHRQDIYQLIDTRPFDQARGTKFGMKNSERYINKSKYLGLKGTWPESYDLFLNFGTLPFLFNYKYRL